MLQTLKYYWPVNLALLLGVALASAILTGAFVTGDSVRGSLNALTRERLGNIDYSLVSQRFFRQELADRFSEKAGSIGAQQVATAIVMTANARHPQTGAAAFDVNLIGIGDDFPALFRQTSGVQAIDSLLAGSADSHQPAVVINRSLQKELGIGAGDRIQLRLAQASDIHRESVFGSKDTESLVQTFRAKIAAVIPDENIGRFGLTAGQSTPQNIFIARTTLQDILEKPASVNAIFVHATTPVWDATRLDSLLKTHWTFADLGLKFRHTGAEYVLESSEFILSPEIETAAGNAIQRLNAAMLPVYTYLANEIRCGERTIPYATIAAIDGAGAARFGGFKAADGSEHAAPGAREIILNDWAQADLQAAPGDSVQISYYLSGSAGELTTETAVLRFAGTVKKEGLAAKRDLTPVFPGMTDAPRIAEWGPPFPVDLSKVRPRDEQYWEDFRALPKAFVTLETGQALWQSRFGRLTSIRIFPVNSEIVSFGKLFRQHFFDEISPRTAGLAFQVTDKRGNPASGATDFSQLFIGFSFFLIISAMLLVGLLFRLAIEQRSREIGMLMAMGYRSRTVMVNLFKEAGLLAGSGALLGVMLGIGYGALMIWGLRTLWVGATGTTALSLYIEPASLINGFLLTLLIAGITIVLMLRKFRELPALCLISGSMTAPAGELHEGMLIRRYQWLFLISIVIALAMLVYAIGFTNNQQPVIFFVSGTLLLAGGIIFAVIWLKQWELYHDEAPQKQISLVSVGIRNNNRRMGRSLLSIALVAFATFLIVAVGANRKDFRDSALQKDAGTGGFALLAEVNIPLVQSLRTAEGQFELGFTAEESRLLQQTGIYPLRLLPGEDASCLNLYKPERPRILGVPPKFIERGGFSFKNTLETADNPWTLLDSTLADGVIPAIGDANSVQWILHAGLGQDMEIRTIDGKALTIRFVALLNTSIFQSEILISEAAFQRLFPGQAGYRYFLIETPPALQDSVSMVLEQALTDFGVDAKSTLIRLAEFQEVENTYLSVFQILGGLGLLLGTFGLGIILVRNALERRGELATLQAFGFMERLLRKMLVYETAFQIVYGIVIGAVAALIAIIPQLLSAAGNIPWLELGITIALILLLALLVSYVAAYRVLQSALLPALKSE